MRVLILCICLFTFQITNAQFAKYVNPFIGTGGTGHTFPGATTPFAMVQLSPDTRIDGSWEGCSGYHYSDSIIHGFSHTHLSGTGCSDYGDIAFMPWFSKTNEFEKLKTWDVQSKFSHKNENASAGYYSVKLSDIPVKVELTATTRTGFQRYTFLEEGYGYIVLNLKHRDALLQGKIQKSKPQTYKGIRVSKAWAQRQELYYGFEISSNRNSQKGDFVTEEEILKDESNDSKLIIKFKVTKGQQILIKTGLSTVDANAALNNLFTENPSWDFEKIKQKAFNTWEKELKKIDVEEAKMHFPRDPNYCFKVRGAWAMPVRITPEQKKVKDRLFTFYTALYHCMIHPSIMNDVDGRYKGRDGKIHKAEGFNYYTVFSLWDTHRALHPLLNIIDKKRSHDFIITFLKQFEQSGRLPMWELWNNETDCMIGFHSVSVILDAYRKEVITKDELQQLWPAVKAEAMSNRFGLDKFREKGYLSVEDESESVSKTLEYSYDMWCVSEIATQLNLRNEIAYFKKFQNAWHQLYHPVNGFIQPRKNGNWQQEFNPYVVNNNYTEANSWQYSFYAPHQKHNINQYMLDSLFKVSSNTQGRSQADITGLIGQYAHGNEPSHNYIYLLSDEKIKQKYLRYVLDSFYANSPIGLIGNEDCGQMSAWYIMSALGFYQTCPGNESLEKGTSLFRSYKIKTSENSEFIFDSTTHKNEYLYERMLNTKLAKNYDYIKNLPKGELRHCAGVRMVDGIFSSAPLIIASNDKPFTDKYLIEIKSNTSRNDSIYYSITSPSNPFTPFEPYDKPFYIYESCKIVAVCNRNNLESNYSIAHFYKRPHNYSIQLKSTYHKQYTADGDDGIIDGQFGDIDWRKGGWQGYQGQDFEAIIDMKVVKQFSLVSANFLQDSRSWILFPTKVEYLISNDGINYTQLQITDNYFNPKDEKVQTQKIPFKTSKTFETARFIKVKATNFGKLPNWHQGKGGDAYIFIDEIEIK